MLCGRVGTRWSGKWLDVVSACVRSSGGFTVNGGVQGHGKRIKERERFEIRFGEISRDYDTLTHTKKEVGTPHVTSSRDFDRKAEKYQQEFILF